MPGWLQQQPNTPGTVLERLRHLAPLSDVEQRLVQKVEQKPRRTHLVHSRFRQDGLNDACFIVTGWAALVRDLLDGRRQIITLLLPGDGLCFEQSSTALPTASIVMLTQVRTVDAAEIKTALKDAPPGSGLAAAMKLALAEETCFLLNQVARLGRQTAYERLAGFLLELNYRFKARGLGMADAFPMPLKQELIADCLGLSVVHVNRTLQQMRREGSVVVGQGVARILDGKHLGAAAEFQPPRLAPVQ